MPDDVGRIQVTPESVAALAASVARARDQLDGTADLVGDCTAALGSAVVVAALHHFVTGWHDGRAQIGAEVGGLADMLRQASEVYTATDGDLAAAIPGGS
jgi:hypothetical protein